MIIKRYYVPIWKLQKTDSMAGRIFDKAFNESFIGLSNDEYKDNAYQYLTKQCLYEMNFDYTFNKISDVIHGFEYLDRNSPYDNGFTYKDVNKVEIVEADENIITLHLINVCEEVEQIVKVEKLVNIPEININTEIEILYLNYKLVKEVVMPEEDIEYKEYLLKAAQFTMTKEVVGVGIYQRDLRIGHPRAVKTVELFEKLGLIVSDGNVKLVKKETLKDFITFLEKF